jgi:tetratricopeptide (TPR) repeat protein
VAAEEAGAACDRLASHPYDPARAADGVVFDDIDVAAAETACRAAVAAHAQEPRYAYLLGRVLHVKEDYAGARQSYEAAAVQDYPMAIFALGILYQYALGVPADAQKAAAQYRRAADRGAAIALSNLGEMYETGSGVAQDYAEAARLYGAALDNGYVGAAVPLGTLYEQGLGVATDGAEAERLFRLAIGSADRDAAANGSNALAWMWAQAGANLQEAEELAAAAAAAYPDEATYHDTLGWVRFRLGRLQEAAGALEQAVALDAEYPGYRARLGDVYAALGRPAAAKAQWQKALDLPSPDSYYEPDWDAAAIARKISEAD